MGEVIDPKKLAENLKERVKQEFVNLIPEEQWEKFIDDTVKEFKEKELKNILLEEIRTYVKNQIREYLASKSNLQYSSETNQQELDKILKDGVAQGIPIMFTDFLKYSITNTIQQMKNNLQY